LDRHHQADGDHKQQLQQATAEVSGHAEQFEQAVRGIQAGAALVLPALLQPLQRLTAIEHLAALIKAAAQQLHGHLQGGGELPEQLLEFGDEGWNDHRRGQHREQE